MNSLSQKLLNSVSTAPKNIPNLGIGVGLRPAYYEDILTQPLPIDWFEIISEEFLDQQGWRFEYLEQIMESYPVVLHGIGLCIGSVAPLDFVYLKKLKTLARKTKTPWVSDHLSWGQPDHAHFHDLCPVPYTKEVEDYIVEKARIVQDFLEIPFALENISSFISYEQDEMPEWVFYSNVVERANIFMMLDVNNIYVSSYNNGFSPQDYIKNIPLNRVLQIHLAGHRNCGDFIRDTHDQLVCDEVWKLYAEIYPLTGGVSTLLEWDENFLSLEETCKEAMKAKQYQTRKHQ